MGRIRDLVVILGIPIDNLNMDEALDRIETLVEDGQRSRRGHQVVTVNTDFIVKALHDPALMGLLRRSALATADGMPIVWGARLLGVGLKERVAGADLVPAICERAALKGFSVYLLGAEPGIAQQAAGVLKARYPSLRIAGVQSPPFAPVEKFDPAILEEIRQSRPDILFVAFGNPKQEHWIGRYGPELQAPVMMGVGASFDFLAGKVKRAPAWMQKSGLEWFYRLIQEPGRLWRRYAVDLFFFSRLFARQVWLLRPHRPIKTASPGLELDFSGNAVVLQAPTELTVYNVAAFHALSEQALERASNLVVNLEENRFLDSAAIGSLVEISRLAQQAGGSLWLAGVSDNIRQVFSLLRLDAYFSEREKVEECLAVCRQNGFSEVSRLSRQGV